MNTNLFRRAWTVQVDNLDVSALDLEFKILSTIKAQPNKCVLTVWNLNRDHRAQMLKRNRPDTGKKIVGIPIQIEAGYINNTSVIFSGDLLEVASQRDYTDWKTVFSGTDGGRSYREATIDTTFTAGTSVGSILGQICEAMGIGLGNSANFEAGAQIAGIGSNIPRTLTVSGNAAKALTRVTASIGLTWSIQKGALQLQQKGKPLNLGAIRIAPDTGLIGSPEASIDSSVELGNVQQFAPGAKPTVAHPPKPKDPTIIRLKTLLIPGLIPGRKITLESAAFNGGYMITEIEYVGQSWGNDWHCNIVARVY